MQATVEKVLRPAEASFRFAVRNDPAFRFCWHFHPEYELTLIRHSRGRRLVGDSIADYRNGDLVLLGPGLPHTWFSDPSGSRRGRHTAVVVQFLGTFLGEGFFERPELQRIALLLKRSARGLCFTGPARDRASRQMCAMARLQGLERLLTLLSVLDELARAEDVGTLASAGFVPVLNRGNQRRVDAVCTYVNENYTGRISQARAAKIAHLSPAAFSRFFKRTTGQGFTRYVNELRVGRACQLLIDSDLPVSDVSLASGFSNLANFNRRFLERKGVSPRDYRRQFAAER